METLRRSKLMELLELQEDQRDQFTSAYSEMRDSLRRLEQHSRGTTERLAELLRQKTASETEISRLVGEIDKQREEKHQVLQRFHQQAERILDARQIGMLTVFQERFERRLLEIVHDIRQRRGQQGPRGPRGPKVDSQLKLR